MTAGTVERYSLIDCQPPRQDTVQEVLVGLSRTPKHLSPKLLYDADGSALFDAITRQPEYYLTRAELSILSGIGTDLESLVDSDAVIVELGSGSGEKTRHLLGMLPTAPAYVAVDISATALDGALDSLADEFPGRRFIGMVADYLAPVALPPEIEDRPKLYVFFGSTLGNFEPPEAIEFLHRMALSLDPDDALMIGIDLKKAHARIHQAYNDASGVTAAFNCNILNRINRDCGANFDLEDFHHEAEYQPEHGRVAMFLVCHRTHTVNVAGVEILFDAGERVTTEYSYKYSMDEFYALARQAGFSPVRSWTDSGETFSLHYLAPDLA